MQTKLNRRGFLGAGAFAAVAGLTAGGEAKTVGGRTFVAAWRAQHPDRPVPTFMEPFEISEYGRAPTEEDLKIIAGKV